MAFNETFYWSMKEYGPVLRLKEKAKELGVSRSFLVRRCIETALDAVCAELTETPKPSGAKNGNQPSGNN